MKQFILNLIFVLLVPIWGFSQTLTTPNSQNIPVGVNGLPISGFSLDGYNSTTSYKVSLAITGNANARFSVGTTTGLTRDYGYNSWTNITAVNFFGTPANIQNAFNSITFNTTNVIDGLINLSVSISSQQANTYYNTDNGHMYQFVQGQFTIDQARSGAKARTFEGQTGYLVNITSQAEQNFINTKVSAYNVWIGLADEGHEGVWKWMDGPEAGQTTTYSNWCGGEPNNWGSGENYVVTRWSGGTCWNDFGPPATTSAGSIGGYIVEYGTWTDPSQSTFNSTQNTQITFTQKNMLWVDYTFKFGSNINATTFNGKMHYQESAQVYATNNTTNLSLNSLGKVNVTNQIQEEALGKKATTVGGNVEWCVLYDYDNTNSRHRVLIDKREFPSGISANTVSMLQLFDLYDGEITFYTEDAYWAQYYIYTNTPITTSNSNYSSYIRVANGYYALRAEFSFADYTGYRPQAFIFNSPSEQNVLAMVNSVVTVSDVYLAFKEYSDNGLMGNQSNFFTSGVQFLNADVDGNNIFDSRDTYKLLDYLVGGSSLLDGNTYAYFMKPIKTSEYNSITKQNWVSRSNTTSTMAPIEINPSALVMFPEYSITWKGDVNLSHSALPTGVSQPLANSSVKDIMSMSVKSQSANEMVVSDIMMEKIGDMVEATISVIPNGNQIGATQFEVSFDNSILEYVKSEYDNKTDINFARNGGSSINIGTLNTSGNAIGKTGYKLTFRPKSTLTNILGLISVKNVETIDTNLNKLPIKIQ